MGWCAPWLLISTKKTIDNTDGTCLDLEAPHEGHSSLSPSSFVLAQPSLLPQQVQIISKANQ